MENYQTGPFFVKNNNLNLSLEMPDEKLQAYRQHLINNYKNWVGKIMTENEPVTDSSDDFEFEHGNKYIKVIHVRQGGGRSAHSFIVIKPTKGKNFKFGDILKAASWKQPTTNFIRGSVLDPKSYEQHRWCGL